MICKPGSTAAKITGKGRKASTLIGCNTLSVCGSNAGDKEVFVDIHSTANRINDFKHNTSLAKVFEEHKQGLDAH